MDERPTFGSLFAGIGGFDLGLERAGWECRFQVEWDEFCQRVLAKHWPDVPRYGDITAVDWSTVERVDLLAGGFPCQPFSLAGQRRGKDDERWLWPAFAASIRTLRPKYLLVENVPGLLAGHGGMGTVLGDLEQLGYMGAWDSIPAAAVGAPHLRYRVWIVAHANELGRLGFAGIFDGFGETFGADSDGRRRQAAMEDPYIGSVESWRGRRRAPEAGPLADADGEGPQGRPVQPERPSERAARPGGMADTERRGRGRGPSDSRRDAERRAAFGGTGPSGGWSDQWRVEPDVGRVAHGVPARVDRLRSLGNAVVPQVVEVIGRRLLERAA